MTRPSRLTRTLSAMLALEVSPPAPGDHAGTFWGFAVAVACLVFFAAVVWRDR